FKIERGTLTFSGDDPQNPTVVATAVHDAPDGSRIFADFAGPVKTGKITLRSEPPHSQDEILSILLFGSPEGAFGTSQAPARAEGQVAATATSIGGSFLAQGLNRALEGLTGADITTRVSTSEAGTPRPELVVQIAKNVSVQAVYNLGTPAPG